MADEDTRDEEFETEDLEEELTPEPEDLDEALVEEDDDEEYEDIEEDEEEDEGVELAPAPKAKAAPAKTRRGGGDDGGDDEVDLDDVEADLDTILKDRIAAQPDEAEEEDEEEQPEVDERGDGTGRIQPKRPGEFVCQSCFLVKHPSQLADADQMLCADCV